MCLKLFKREKKRRIQNGDNVELTWLPDHVCRFGVSPNAYIGMSGVVHELQKNGVFWLRTDTSWLLVNGKYKVKFLDNGLK